MKVVLTIITLLAVVLTLPAEAKKGKSAPQPAAAELRIVAVDAVSIQVSVGKSGDEHMTYKITDATKITLNGAPVAARELRSGMMAKVETGSDPTIATTIVAKDAPAHPEKHHVG